MDAQSSVPKKTAGFIGCNPMDLGGALPCHICPIAPLRYCGSGATCGSERAPIFWGFFFSKFADMTSNCSFVTDNPSKMVKPNGALLNQYKVNALEGWDFRFSVI